MDQVENSKINLSFQNVNNQITTHRKKFINPIEFEEFLTWPSF